MAIFVLRMSSVIQKSGPLAFGICRRSTGLLPSFLPFIQKRERERERERETNMAQRGRPRQLDGATPKTVRFDGHVVRHIERNYGPGSFGRIVREAVDEWLATKSAQYAARKAHEHDEAARAYRDLAKMAERYEVALDAELRAKMERRVKQMRLQDFETRQQIVWLRAQGFPEKHHQRYLEMMQEMVRA